MTRFLGDLLDSSPASPVRVPPVLTHQHKPPFRRRRRKRKRRAGKYEAEEVQEEGDEEEDVSGSASRLVSSSNYRSLPLSLRPSLSRTRSMRGGAKIVVMDSSESNSDSYEAEEESDVKESSLAKENSQPLSDCSLDFQQTPPRTPVSPARLHSPMSVSSLLSSSPPHTSSSLSCCDHSSSSPVPASMDADVSPSTPTLLSISSSLARSSPALGRQFALFQPTQSSCLTRSCLCEPTSPSPTQRKGEKKTASIKSSLSAEVRHNIQAAGQA